MLKLQEKTKQSALVRAVSAFVCVAVVLEVGREYDNGGGATVPTNNSRKKKTRADADTARTNADDLWFLRGRPPVSAPRLEVWQLRSRQKSRYFASLRMTAFAQLTNLQGRCSTAPSKK